MVSVIIPVYNRAKYIEDCLNSVLNQTYKDYEIIVVDDGSTDNLKQVLLPYLSKINYIHKENGGAASARNVGIRNAKGEYIAWLDSDDRWFDFKLELQMMLLEKIPELGFICSDFACFSDEKGKISDSYILDYFTIYDQYNLSFEKMFPHHLTLGELNINHMNRDSKVYWGDISDKVIWGPLFLTSTVITRRACITDIGFFNEKYSTIEDYDFHSRIIKKYKAAYVDIPTMEYRRYHADQISGPHMRLQKELNLLDIAINLCVKDEGFFEKSKKSVNLKLSQCYSAVADVYYRDKNYKNAWKYFLSSIKFNFLQKRVYWRTFVSFINIIRINFFVIFSMISAKNE